MNATSLVAYLRHQRILLPPIDVNRLLKLAREGTAMIAQHLRELEPARRLATLVAVALETRATLTEAATGRHHSRRRSPSWGRRCLL